MLLDYLRTVAMQRDDVVIARDTLAALEPRVQPLFSVEHPQKGRIAGPCARLDARSQRAAQSLAYALGSE